MLPLVGVIINFNAMLIKRKGLRYINKLREIASRYERVKIFIPQSQTQVRSIIRKLKDLKTAYICSCGGDGALRHIIQQAVRIYKAEDLPIITPIGGGSMSMIAKALGFTKEPHQNLITVLNLREEVNQPTYLKELIKIDDAGKIYFGFFFSIGVVVDYLKYYEKTSKGLWAAIYLIFRCIIGTVFKKFRIYHYAQANVLHDGQEFAFTKFAGIIAANIKDVVLTFKPLSGIIQKKSFLLGIFALNAYEILNHIFKYLWGKPVYRDLKTGKVINGNCQELILQTNEDMIIDGDVFPNRKKETRIIKITVGPTIPMLNLRSNTSGI